MKSRVYPTYKTKYRVTNWRAYERSLVQRGDVTLWLSADARDAWRPSPSGQPGGQQRFSDLAITTALTLRLVFHLPLSQAEGFVRSVLSLMDVDLEAPDHTTLSRRSRHLDVELHRGLTNSEWRKYPSVTDSRYDSGKGSRGSAPAHRAGSDRVSIGGSRTISSAPAMRQLYQ
jgi:hypothetical protein